MGFVGGIIAAVFIIFFSLVGSAFLFLIIGIVIRKKHPIVSKILFFLSCINISVPILAVAWLNMPHSKTVETRDGTAKIKGSWIGKYDKYLEENDIQKLNDLLDKHPEMIYYYEYGGADNHCRILLLDYGMNNLNVDIMQAAIDHGAVFDDPVRYKHLIYDTSFEAFFFELNENIYTEGDVDDKMFTAIEFMINHGAALQYKSYAEVDFDNFYDHMTWWVGTDGIVTDKEQQLLELIASHMENSNSD